MHQQLSMNSITMDKLQMSIAQCFQIKFKYFQGPSDTDSKTLKKHVSFQTFQVLKIWEKFKNFQGPARALHIVITKT